MRRGSEGDGAERPERPGGRRGSHLASSAVRSPRGDLATLAGSNPTQRLFSQERPRPEADRVGRAETAQGRRGVSPGSSVVARFSPERPAGGGGRFRI